MKIKKYDNAIRNILIVLSTISLIITSMHFTYNVYNDRDALALNNFLVKYIDGWLVWIVFILIIVFSCLYIRSAIKTKEDITIVISYIVLTIFTNVIPLTLIINMIAKIFGII